MEDLKGIKTVGDLLARIETNPDLASKLGAQPAEILRAADVEMRDNQPLPNTPIYRAAVLFVGLTLLVTVIGALTLVGLGND